MFTTGTGEAASSAATAAGAAAHSCCSNSTCSGALAPPAAGVPSGPEAVAPPLCSGSGAVPAAAQCCSACGGSRLRPKSVGGSAGAPAAAAVLDRPELPLPRPAVKHGTWNVDGSHLHSSPADQSGADHIAGDQVHLSCKLHLSLRGGRRQQRRQQARCQWAWRHWYCALGRGCCHRTPGASSARRLTFCTPERCQWELATSSTSMGVQTHECCLVR
jgi:hypothetical protein